MIRAIETRYAGCRFRSRLEARWAVFFDTLGIKWEYEAQGFDLGDGDLYLPDFWIPTHSYQDKHYPQGNPPTPGWWVEIKPVALTDHEERLCRKLSKGTGHVVYALAGRVGAEEFESYKWHPRCETGGITKGRTNPDERRWSSDFFYNTFLFYLCSQVIDGDWLERKDLEKAFRAARSARFEHGEHGRG